MIDYGCWKDLLKIVEIEKRLMIKEGIDHTFSDIEIELFAKKLQEDFSYRYWKVLIFISFVPTKEAKQRKTPGEYRLLKSVNATKKS